MKTIACLLFCAGLFAVTEDFCVCGGCLKDREAIGVCRTCKGGNLTIDDATCGACARKAGSCMHCGKKLRNPKLLLGEAFRVDKQPRADLNYHVVKAEDGTAQGVYVRFEALKGRALFSGAEDAKGDLVIRKQVELDPKEKDLEVKGESAGPVSWRLWDLAGPAVPSKEGKFVLVLPAMPGGVFEVVSGETILSRHRYESGAWKTLK